VDYRDSDGDGYPDTSSPLSVAQRKWSPPMQRLMLDII